MLNGVFEHLAIEVGRALELISASASSNPYAFFVLFQLPAYSITRLGTLAQKNSDVLIEKENSSRGRRIL